ncbi:serine hydrolase domain-containing protein [Pseudomonas sp. RIT-PI-S]|uniref:serine hydrolase domain-containing protein n=1 Tax=Pseudomonas sp. RIT-PI-S TaxID=3035295 RepID=UPI0021D8C1F7|nr:serine hydrolase domain-containing protein [Pseudomonas sp. RIT-PI-S]
MLCSLVSNGVALHREQPDAVVPWWSFTKTVLAAAALSLVRDGLIGLDDLVAEGPFSLRQLLQHQAGLADYSELADYPAAVAAGDAPWAAEAMLQRLDAARLRYRPGTQWRYSNVGYLFVAQLIERLTGLPLEQAVEQRVLAPLAVPGVFFARSRADLENVSRGVAPGYDPGWVYHGLLVGPLSGAALLLDRLLGGPLLPPALREEMQRPLVLSGPIPGRPWVAPGYALGLMVGVAEGGLTLCGHRGCGPGSTVAIYRATQGAHTASCAVFIDGDDQIGAEAHALRLLSASLASIG